jgi:outer membrane protein TolC
LITSLTTILGMTPIALGFGEGGRILQPLGISIAGGLWFSTILTLFLVPSLHARLLLNRERRDNGGVGPNGTAELGAASVAKVILACLLAAGASWATPARAEALPQTDETSMQQQLKAWLAEALQQSVNIRATSSQADAARVKSESTQRFQGLVPKVDASASWTRSFRDDDPSAMLFSFGSPSKLGAQTQERLDGDVQIRSSLFAGGRYFAEHDAALQEWKAAQARATEASAAELERVAHVMVDLLETSQRTQQNLQRQELLAQTLSVAQQRFDRAQIARSDVTRIQRQITLSDSAKTDQSMALELFRRELQSYLQEQPIPQDLPAELFTATSLRFALEGIAKPPQDHNSEGQASEQPTIAALRAELSALSARREVQRAAQRPRLDAVLAADLDRMLRPQSQTGYASSIGLEASWRLCDGGGSGRDDEVFAHEEKALRSRLEATEERHNQDLDRNRTALRRALSSMVKLDRLILDARDAFEAQQKRFSEGRVSVFELVSDAQELWQLEDSLIAQRTLAQKAWMTLCRTLAMAPRQCLMLD